MSRKVSRTGKKKKTQYGPGGQQKAPQITVGAEEQARMRAGRKFNWISVGLLLVAMIAIIFTMRLEYNSFNYNAVSVFAYVLTIIAGGLMLYSAQYASESRRTTAKITGVVMMFVGLFGIVNTFVFAGMVGA